MSEFGVERPEDISESTWALLMLIRLIRSLPAFELISAGNSKKAAMELSDCQQRLRRRSGLTHSSRALQRYKQGAMQARLVARKSRLHLHSVAHSRSTRQCWQRSEYEASCPAKRSTRCGSNSADGQFVVVTSTTYHSQSPELSHIIVRIWILPTWWLPFSIVWPRQLPDANIQ